MIFFFGGGGGEVNIMGGGELQIMQMANWMFYVTWLNYFFVVLFRLFQFTL